MHSAQSITDVALHWPTLDELVRTLTLRAGYNAAVVVVGTTMLGLAAGVVGTFALLRRRALMGDALAHAALPGVAIAFLIAVTLGMAGKSLAVLLPGAAITGVLGVLAVQFIVRNTRLTEDTAIGAVLSVFFGAGVVLLSVVQASPAGDQAGLATFIYGQTAAMTVADATLMGAVALVAALAAALLFKEFALVCFDDAFARVQGRPVNVIDLLMMSLVVLVTVAGLHAVGLILVVALLIIPAAAARFWTESLWRMTVFAGAIGAASGYLGSVTSALMPRMPAGAVIVLASGVIFIISMFLAPSRGVLASAARSARLRLKIARDHMLLAALRLGDDSHGARVTINDLARARGWRVNSARAIAWTLARTGHGELHDGSLTLTATGFDAARRVARTRALWEEYLTRCADVAPSHVDYSADLIEHVLPPDLVRDLEAALDSAHTAEEVAA